MPNGTTHDELAEHMDWERWGLEHGLTLFSSMADSGCYVRPDAPDTEILFIVPRWARDAMDAEAAKAQANP